MDQTSFLAHCASVLRSTANDLSKPRSRSRKSVVTIGSVDALEERLLLTNDFGDAPTRYPVTLADNGARHTVTGPTLGLTVDSELDGTPSNNADSDGADDDGVIFGQVNAGRIDATVVVKVRNASVGTKLDAWVDFNADGDWSDPGEQVFDSVTVFNNTDQTLTFIVPEDAVLGTTYARFRISSAGGLEPTGDAPDGEVEDLKVRIGVAAPEVISPAASEKVNVTGTNRVSFDWSAVPQAESYEVWIRSYNYRAQSEFNRTIVTDTTYTPDVDFGVGNYAVWVRSIGTDGQRSSWSAIRPFAVVAKTTITPMARMQNTSRPTITWDPVLGAQSYKVWISNLSTGQSPVILESGLTGTSFTPSSSLPLGLYRVWVAAYSGSTTAGWSLPVDFQAAPAPTTQAVTPTMLTNTFVWSSVLGASNYEFQLRNLNNGETVLSSMVEGTSWTPGTVLYSGVQYRWWVRARSEQGAFSLWSAPSNFVAGGQTNVLTPTGTTSNQTPTFSWDAVQGASRYQILVHRTDVSTAVINRTNVLTNSFTPTAPLAAGTYRVWVRAFSSSGVVTTWSQTVTFTITKSDSPVEEIAEVPPLLVALLENPVSSSHDYYPGNINEQPSISDRAHVQDSFNLEPPVESPALDIPGEQYPSQQSALDLIDIAIFAWVNRSANAA